VSIAKKLSILDAFYASVLRSTRVVVGHENWQAYTTPMHMDRLTNRWVIYAWPPM